MSPDKDETAGVNKAGNRRIRGTNRLACLDYERRTGQKKADARSMLGPRWSLGERHAGRRPMPSARTRAARTAVLHDLCTAAVLCHLNDVSLQVAKNSSEYQVRHLRALARRAVRSEGAGRKADEPLRLTPQFESGRSSRMEKLPGNTTFYQLTITLKVQTFSLQGHQSRWRQDPPRARRAAGIPGCLWRR